MDSFNRIHMRNKKKAPGHIITPKYYSQFREILQCIELCLSNVQLTCPFSRCFNFHCKVNTSVKLVKSDKKFAKKTLKP